MQAPNPSHIHPPHHETWDGDTRTMRNREGVIRRLDACEVTHFGLYGRRMFHRAASRAIGQQVWLLPKLGLRVISWIPRPGVTDIEDYYIDIASITVTGSRFELVDYYLDIRVWTGERADVIDQDEYVAAIGAGYLDQGTAEQALHDAFHAADGLARHEYDLSTWLMRDHNIRLTWESV